MELSEAEKAVNAAITEFDPDKAARLGLSALTPLHLFDSVDMVSVVTILEDNLNIEIDDREVGEAHKEGTLADIYRIIARIA